MDNVAAYGQQEPGRERFGLEARIHASWLAALQPASYRRGALLN